VQVAVPTASQLTDAALVVTIRILRDAQDASGGRYDKITAIKQDTPRTVQH
jgi:hypothetical protein